MLTRTHDATKFNAVLNHPAVRPWVADIADGDIDVTDRVSHPANVTLIGEHGGFFLFKYFEGVYEVHTAFLPEGRGEWGMQAAKECLHYMFTATDCIEILTRVPQGHVAAKALTEAAGFRYQFTTPADCLFRGKMVPCHIYSLTIQEWTPRAGLEDDGALFHTWLNARIGNGHGEPHPADPAHNLIVGISLAMLGGKQVRKAVVFYNRCAVVARHATIALLNEDPPTIRFDVGVLTFREDGIHFAHSN